MLAIQRYSVTGAVDAAFWMYRRHFRVLFTISLLVNVLPLATNLVVAWAQHGMQAALAGGFDFARVLPAVGTWVGVMAVSSMVGLVCGMFGIAAATHVASRAALGETPDLSQALETAMRFFWPVLGAALLTSMAIMLGFLFLIVPGIILTVGLAFVTPVLVLEQRTVTEALERSWLLTKGRRGKVLAVLALITIPVVTATIAMVAVGMLLDGVQGTLVGDLAQALFAQCVSAVATPLWWIAMVLLYYDSRVDKEAFDVEMLARGAASQS